MGSCSIELQSFSSERASNCTNKMYFGEFSWYFYTPRSLTSTLLPSCQNVHRVHPSLPSIFLHGFAWKCRTCATNCSCELFTRASFGCNAAVADGDKEARTQSREEVSRERTIGAHGTDAGKVGSPGTQTRLSCQRVADLLRWSSAGTVVGKHLVDRIASSFFKQPAELSESSVPFGFGHPSSSCFPLSPCKKLVVCRRGRLHAIESGEKATLSPVF